MDFMVIQKVNDKGFEYNDYGEVNYDDGEAHERNQYL